MKLFILWTVFGLGNAAAFVMKKQVPAKIRKQIMPVLAVLLLFSLAAVRYVLAADLGKKILLIAGLSAAVPAAALAAGLRRDRTLFRFSKPRALICAAIPAVFIAASVSEIFTYPLWDAAVYTESVNRITSYFDFGLRTGVTDYFICGHISLGSTFFLLIGNFLAPGSAGPLLAQVLLASLSACAMYETLFTLRSMRGGRPVKRTDPLVLALTALYMFSPALFGMAGDLSVDYGMLCLLPFVLLSAVRKWGYLELLSALAFCMTKEPAVMIYGGFAGILILAGFREKPLSARLFGWARRLIPLLSWAFLYFFAGAWGGGASFGGEENSFALNPDFILTKLKQFLFADLNWLLILAVLAAAAVFAVSREKKAGKPAGDSPAVYVLGLSCGFLAYIAFSCLYVTAVHYRYIMIATYWYVFLLAAALFSAPGRMLLKTASVSVLCAALLAQSFTNIDFVSARLFPQYPVNESGGTQPSLSYFHDGIIFNRSYHRHVRLLEKALIESGAGNTTVILVPEGGSAWNYAGWWPHGYYLDTKNRRFAASPEQADVHLCMSDGQIVLLDELASADPERFDRAVCIDFPWTGYTAAEGLAGKMDVEESFTVTLDGWEAKVYTGTLRREAE